MSANKRRPTLAIDFDGVIHRYSKGYKDGSLYDRPIRGAKLALRKLMRTNCVFILSTRPPEHIKEWMTKWMPEFVTEIVPLGVFPPFWNKENVIGITQQKLAAEAYVDDRAIRFSGSWQRTLKHF